MRKSKTVLDRIYKHMTKDKKNHWVWSGARESSGIPRIYVGDDEKKNPMYKSPVRILWEDERKGPLEESEFLVRRCGANDCINPHHHEKTEGRSSALSEKKREKVRDYYLRGSPCALLSREFKVSRSSIVRIVEELRGEKNNDDPKSD